jgi:putative DNA modification/repair radical SAM protein
VEYRIQEEMSIMDKLNILSDAAKYDVACTSSGTERSGDGTGMGNAFKGGICHSFAGDGRCISLLKILFTNECIYNCKYCINCVTNDVPRASFTPDEICDLTMNFYKRNYIEGLFLSSGIIQNPTYTMELIYQAINKLRTVHNFQGYIHVKAIPGADERIIEKLGLIVDRMSINLELPTAEGLKEIAPNKTRQTILKPMRQIQTGIHNNKNELMLYKHAPKFVPAGQSTQMVIGATPESDYQIVSVAEKLYQRFDLKRVFYSAFVNVNHDKELPATLDGPPLLREHRLYQADWLLRFYGFKADELLSEDKPNFNTLFDPKCDWALRHLEFFPVEVNRADKNTLLRVPGIGTKSAQRIIWARRHGALSFDDLKKMGVVLKRALYFITCGGRMMYRTKIEEDYISQNLLDVKERLPAGISRDGMTYKQLSLFDDVNFGFQSQVTEVLGGQASMPTNTKASMSTNTQASTLTYTKAGIQLNRQAEPQTIWMPQQLKQRLG